MRLSASLLSRAGRAKIWLSQAESIHENLALEEFLFRSESFADYDGLLLWRNRPAVVFGRFQNPWAECRVDLCRDGGIELARRWSGGGTVLHDMDNLNISVLSTQKRHDRAGNMRLLGDVLRDNWGVETEGGRLCVNICDLQVSARHDLLLLPTGAKLSGTAARVSAGKAYHHFTLLVNADRGAMSRLLKPALPAVVSTASKSVPATVASLGDIKRFDISPQSVAERLADAFARQYFEVETAEVEPWLPPLFSRIREGLATQLSWEWIFGATPDFTLPILTEDAREVHLKVHKGRLNGVVEGDRGEKTHKLLHGKFSLETIQRLQEEL